MSKIVRCFFDTHMGLAHDGLKEVAKRHQLNLDKLAEGEFVVFINTSKDRLKVFASQNTFAYWRAQKGVKLDLRVIREIPRIFTGSAIGEYDKALEAALTHKLASRKAVNKPRFSALDAVRYARELRL
jgi:hypothetical protein